MSTRARQRPPFAPRAPAGGALLLVAVALVALNLRPAVAAVAPVLSEIQRTTGLSNAAAGLLTTLPLLAFGVCAPLAPVLSRRLGMEGTVVAALSLLVAGLLVRSVPPLAPLFVGTAALGVAIAIGNVIVPALIKRDFGPKQTRLATAVYSVALSAGSPIAAGVTVPLEHASGADWRGALAWWALPVAACLAVWVGRLRRAGDVRPAIARSGVRLWRDPLAWQVTVFMGIQALGFYSLLAWVPTIFEHHGVHAVTAGWLLSLSGFASLPSAFVAPVLASTAARQRSIVAAAIACNLVALAGLVWAPVSGALAWMIVLGIGQGGLISLALAFIVLRAPTSRLAADLSGMAQTIGYLVAAAGPVVVGALRGTSGGWTLPLVVLAVMLAPELGCGMGAARSRVVGEGRRAATPGGGSDVPGQST